MFFSMQFVMTRIRLVCVCVLAYLTLLARHKHEIISFFRSYIGSFRTTFSWSCVTNMQLFLFAQRYRVLFITCYFS